MSGDETSMYVARAGFIDSRLIVEVKFAKTINKQFTLGKSRESETSAN